MICVIYCVGNTGKGVDLEGDIKGAVKDILSLRCFLSFSFSFFFCGQAACGILVPKPGIKPMPFAMVVWISNHQTTMEFPMDLFKPIQVLGRMIFK